MLEISRWAGKGGSYRTIQRFFYTPMNWPTLLWVFFHSHCFRAQQRYAIAGDEVVTSKSGEHTYGVDWFFSSLYKLPIRGLAFFVLPLVGLEERHSFPLRIEQVLRSPEATPPPSSHSSTQGKRKPGRPKGVKNKDKTHVTLSPKLDRIRGMLTALLETIGLRIPLRYVLLDGKFGHNNALQMVRQLQLHPVRNQMRGLLHLASVKSDVEMVECIEFLSNWMNK